MDNDKTFRCTPEGDIFYGDVLVGRISVRDETESRNGEHWIEMSVTGLTTFEPDGSTPRALCRQPLNARIASSGADTIKVEEYRRRFQAAVVRLAEVSR